MIYLEPEKIKIYKVKPWAVYFKHGDEYYLLHYGGDLYEEKTVLYKKILDNNGQYELKYIHFCYGKKIPNCVFESNVYSHINKKRFIYYLTFYGFIKSRFSPYVENAIKKKNKLMDKITDLQDEIRKIQNNINKMCPR